MRIGHATLAIRYAARALSDTLAAGPLQENQTSVFSQNETFVVFVQCQINLSCTKTTKRLPSATACLIFLWRISDSNAERKRGEAGIPLKIKYYFILATDI